MIKLTRFIHYICFMKKLLASLVFSLFLLNVFSQNKFDRIFNIPVRSGAQTLQNPWAGGINFPLISEVDMNGDGLHDLFVYDRHNRRVLTFINTGLPSTDAWRYDTSFTNKFPKVNEWAFLHDYNCDGKADFFTLTSSGPPGIMAYRNDYTTGTGLQFTLVSPLLMEQISTITSNIFASALSLPAFVDIDNDGDMDILGYNSVPDGRIVLHRNLSMDNFGHCDSLKFQFATGCFGNFALQIGGSNVVGCFNCPCRISNPAAEPGKYELEPFDQSDAARRDDTVSSVFALDLDGDGDKELLVGDISSTNTLMILNGGTTASAQMISEDINYPSSDIPASFNGFHYHAYADIDNDSKKDLLVMSGEFENREGIWWYKNSGSNSSPSFSLAGKNFLQGQMIDVGESASPVLFDFDADGLLDLIIGSSTYINATGSYKNSLTVYRNTGTITAPAFEFVTDDFANLSSVSYSPPIYPSFGDMDNDGDMDMIIGTDDGKLYYYNNSAGAGNPASFQLAVPAFMNIDVGNASTPQIVDVNRDGKPDLLIGEKNGFVNYFENAGSASAPLFNAIPNNDTLGCIVRQSSGLPDGYTVPFMFDSLGHYRLMVADMAGNVYQYTKIDGQLNSCFVLSDSLYKIPESMRTRFNMTVSGGDLNGDGLTDLVVGMAGGGVQVFYQYNPNASVESMVSGNFDFEIFPNPATDVLHVSIFTGNFDAHAVLKLFDGTGRLLLTQSVNAEKNSINLKEYSGGIYFIVLESSAGRKVRRFVLR